MPQSGHGGQPDLQLVPALTARAASSLSAVHYDDGAVWVVELFGEADVSTRRTLEEALTRGLSRGRGAMLLDVSHLTFCDAACVGAVLDANTDGGVVLAGASGSVSRVFEILDPEQTIARYRAS
jgi:anti-anti-sigma factor